MMNFDGAEDEDGERKDEDLELVVIASASLLASTGVESVDLVFAVVVVAIDGDGEDDLAAAEALMVPAVL